MLMEFITIQHFFFFGGSFFALRFYAEVCLSKPKLGNDRFRDLFDVTQLCLQDLGSWIKSH